MNGFNITSISDCFIGGAQASAIYKGGTQLWSATADYSKRYLTIESAAADNKIDWILSDFSAIAVNIQWSKDGVNWTTVTSSPSGTTLTTLGNGEKLYLKGTNNQIGTSSRYHSSFIITKACNLSGNIMSLLYGEGFSTNSTFGNYSYIFHSLFTGCHIVSAANLVLPAYTLAPYCYSGMFSYCSYLTTPPKLPAQYLAEGCYDSMFKSCTSLVDAPELPSTTLVTGCYNEMFYGCSSLRHITALFVNEIGTGYTDNWLYGVASPGYFYYYAEVIEWNAEDWANEASGIPAGWFYRGTLSQDNGNDLTMFIDYFSDALGTSTGPNDIRSLEVVASYNGYNSWSSYVTNELLDDTNYSCNGAKAYRYDEKVLLYNNHWYYVWNIGESHSRVDFTDATSYDNMPAYLLTDTIDFTKLYNMSLAIGPTNFHVPYTAVVYKDSNDNLQAYAGPSIYKYPKILIKIIRYIQ